MKLFKKALLTLVFCMFLLGDITVHASDDGQWRMMPEKFNVPLNKPWTVVFTQDVTPDKIDGIAVFNEQTNMYIPTNIELFLSSNKKQVKITPVNNYDSNTKYSLRLFLNNGKRIKMYFNTQNLNNLEYIDFSELDHKYGGPYECTSCDKFNDSYNYIVRQKEYTLGNSIKSMLIGTEANITYLLNNNYRKLTGEYATTDKCSKEKEQHIKIIGDGKELLNVACQKGDKPVYFELDVTGVDRLEFKFFIEGDTDNVTGVLMDLKLGYSPGTNLDR